MSVPRSDITSYFSPLSVYCGDEYVASDVSDFRSTSDDCGSAACSICRQDSGNEESMDAGSSFSSPPMIVGTPEAWVIPTVMATLQARRLPPTNSGRPDVDPAFLYIYTYPVSSCWLFEQCSKFNPHPYVHSVRPELGDRNIARSFSPYSLYSNSIPMVTGSPLTLHCSHHRDRPLTLSYGLSLFTYYVGIYFTEATLHCS